MLGNAGCKRSRSIKLANYSKGSYTPGASLIKILAWWYFGQPILRSRILPISAIKVCILRIFGSHIGDNVIIKPGVVIKYPWRLSVGDYVWIGEDVWIDNLAKVSFEDNVCVSQGAYLCTGSHNWSIESFDLITEPIVIKRKAWIAAFSRVGPGVTIGEGAVLTLGSVAVHSLDGGRIYGGNPAKEKSRRKEK